VAVGLALGRNSLWPWDSLWDVLLNVIRYGAVGALGALGAVGIRSSPW
jgi:hypothetical protein